MSSKAKYFCVFTAGFLNNRDIFFALLNLIDFCVKI